MTVNLQELNKKIEAESAFLKAILAELDKVIVGQRLLVERLLIGLLANGHILVEGVPGLAKTLAVKSLAQAIRTKFQRMQFTPDMLPADIVGTLIYDQKKQEFVPKPGPVFANLILADEINRAPAKVQSALLEAMQERQITLGDTTFALEDPFLVLATQNPIEQEGTYPLPEAQIDRFMLKLKIGYPAEAEELEILRRHGQAHPAAITACAKPEQIMRARQVISEIYMDEKIERYIVKLVQATRQPGRAAQIHYGASPRATLCLAQAARAQAFLQQRGYVAPEDVQSVAMDVLRHRVLLTYEAEAEEMTPEKIVDQILEQVEIP